VYWYTDTPLSITPKGTLALFDELDPRSPTPLYEQIAQRVRALVASGDARPGTPLPSVRQFAAELRVNPATVAQAYRQLEASGFVSSRRGQGTFVNAISTDRRADERAEQARRLVRDLVTEAVRQGVSGDELERALAAELSRAEAQRVAAAGTGGDDG